MPFPSDRTGLLLHSHSCPEFVFYDCTHSEVLDNKNDKNACYKKAANKNNNKRNPPHVVHLDEFFAKLEGPFNWLHLICSAKTCVGDKISCIQAISFAFFDVLHLISSFMV